MKLNLGSGTTDIPGYINVDREFNQEVYPLQNDNESIEIIRASHILEHFSHTEIGSVLANWYSVLKPGGTIKIAVPDFDYIILEYMDGKDLPLQGYIMGGQTDQNDYHKCIFNKDTLTKALESAGFTNIQEWASEIDDCASLPISLNLQGTKPIEKQRLEFKHVGSTMSVPRLGFMDNFFCAFQALSPLKITMRKQTGAFWGQCLERAIEETIKDGKSWVLTIDYDTIFTKDDVQDLIELTYKYPEADAIAPIQVHRTKHTPLMTIKKDGVNQSEVLLETFDTDITKINTAHFGLTLLNVDKLKKMPKPWFWSKPGVDGWDDAKEDDDIFFWKRWEEAGNSLYLANRISVGHAELMIRWPSKEFKAIHQHPSEFYEKGKPEDTWS